MKNIPRWVSLLEVALFYALAEWIIWFGGAYRPTILVVAILIIVLCVASNRLHGDTRERIGLGRGTFWPTMKMALPITLPFTIPLVLIILQRQNFATWNWKFSFFGYPIWGFAQEYTLLGFIANRLEDGLPDHKSLVPWINGLLFSLAHAPNPVLMTVTFVSGVLFTALFFRRRNLIAYALLHAVFGILISVAFGRLYGIMSVGTSYTRRMGNVYKVVDPRN
jgi:membrane protease YdiL (CAAX protease family)